MLEKESVQSQCRKRRTFFGHLYLVYKSGQIVTLGYGVGKYSLEYTQSRYHAIM